MPFVIATEVKAALMPGGSPNPAGTLVQWYYLGHGKWTREMGRAQRYDDMDAATQMVLLKDLLPKQRFTFLVVDQLPVAAEAAAMDPAELVRLRKLAREFKLQIIGGYDFKELPAPHEPRIYKIGQRQCQCKLCVQRLIDLFPELR